MFLGTGVLIPYFLFFTGTKSPTTTPIMYNSEAKSSVNCCAEKKQKAVASCRSARNLNARGKLSGEAVSCALLHVEQCRLVAKANLT